MTSEPAAGPPPVTVLCITGWCRNGSTIIGNILNESHGVIHVGELHFLWKNAAGRGANNRCGCGLALTDCPVWSVILAASRPYGAAAGEFAAQVLRRQRASVRTRHTWRVLRAGLDSADIREHAALMARTYRAIAEHSGARVIVETSKMPGEAALLPYLEGVTPCFVHLVRDPRAVAESWRAPKDYVFALSAAKSTGYWLGFNLAARAIARRYPERSLLVRYEDFIADPERTVGSLLRLAGADPAVNPLHGRVIELRTNHTVTGNPDRFLVGPTAIRDADDAWRAGLPARARLTAMALSWPLRRRYGYRWRDRPAGRAAGERREREERAVGSGA